MTPPPPDTTVSFSVSPTSLTFSATQGGSNPAPQNLSLSNSDASGSTLNYSATTNQAWLTVSPTSGALAAGASTTLTVSVNIAGLSAGTQSGAITISDPNATNSPQTVAVTLTVPLAPPTISFSPTGLSFTATQGGANPAPQNLSLSNSGASGSTLNYSATTNQPWLSISPTSGSVTSGASTTLTVSVNISGLSAGTQSGVITISDPNATNSPQTVAVTLTVTPGRPTIAVSPTTLTFTATQEGGSNPATQNVTLTNSGASGSTLNYSVATNQSWFSVSPTSGSVAAGASATLTVSVNIAGLPAGTQSGTITVSDPNATTSPQMVTVTLGVEQQECVVAGIKRVRPQVIAAGIDPMIVDLGDSSLRFLAIVRPGAEPIRAVTFSENRGQFNFPLEPKHTLRNCDVIYAAQFNFRRGEFGRGVIREAFGPDPGQFQFRVTDAGASAHSFPDIEFIDAPALEETVTLPVVDEETPGTRRRRPQVLAAGIDPIIIDTFNDTELNFVALVRPGPVPVRSVTFSENQGRLSFPLSLDEELPSGDQLYRGRFSFERFQFGVSVLRAVFGPKPGQFKFTVIDQAQQEHSFPDFTSGDFPALQQ